jgi:hypothetical protein
MTVYTYNFDCIFVQIIVYVWSNQQSKQEIIIQSYKIFLPLLEKSTNCSTSSHCSHTKYQISSSIVTPLYVRYCLRLHLTYNGPLALMLFCLHMSPGPTVSKFLIQSYLWIWFSTWALDLRFPVFLQSFLWVCFSDVSPWPIIRVVPLTSACSTCQREKV